MIYFVISCRYTIFIVCANKKAILPNVGYLDHGRFGHGHFDQDISATDISAM